MTTMPPDAASVEARLQQALALHQQGRLADALPLYDALLCDHPEHAQTLHLRGVAALQTGAPGQAVELIARALALQPDRPEYHQNHAFALRTLGHHAEALSAYERLATLLPEAPDGPLGCAMQLRALGRPDEAVASYDRALTLRPDMAEAWFNRGNLQLELGRLEAAVADYREALARKPTLAEAHAALGKALLQAGDAEGSLEPLEHALALRPAFPEAQLLRGNALFSAGRLTEALTSYEQTLAQKPDQADALANRGRTLYGLGRDKEALTSLQQAAALQPGNAETFLFMGLALDKLFYLEAALAAYDSALSLRPDHTEAWHNKAMALFKLNRVPEAVAALEAAVQHQPDHAYLRGELLHTRMYLCDWTDFATNRNAVVAAIRGGSMAILPFALQSMVDDPALHLSAARLARQSMHWPEAAAVMPPPAADGRIRIGYFSADFRDHPVSHLTARLFEGHDRRDFEVIGFGFGPPSSDAGRQRVQQAVDRFVDISALSDEEAVQQARTLGVDIAIDLGGYTQNSRSGLFARRVAPVQVSYIGFLGTMGAPWMDYLVADATLVPASHVMHYEEKIACLPWYQANDTQRPDSGRVFGRAELGLPAEGVVFASFNNHFKITPEVFDCWMQILGDVPGSTLFLLVDNALAQENLRRAAEARGVAGVRLVFGARLPRADYLARYRVADLFLDTWPCNAGTTASDSLWMGLPILTCQGQSFGSRMAASVLQAIGLPALITRSPEEYRRRAVELATQPGQLALLRQKIAQQRDGAPLFDTPRFIGHLEAAFRAMHARRLAGLPPDHLSIDP